jgi:hypothetical protein
MTSSVFCLSVHAWALYSNIGLKCIFFIYLFIYNLHCLEFLLSVDNFKEYMSQNDSAVWMLIGLPSITK